MFKVIVILNLYKLHLVLILITSYFDRGYMYFESVETMRSSQIQTFKNSKKFRHIRATHPQSLRIDTDPFAILSTMHSSASSNTPSFIFSKAVIVVFCSEAVLALTA